MFRAETTAALAEFVEAGVYRLAPLRCLLLIGTRPEAIKMAPLVRECRSRSDQMQALVCFTGQHEEMTSQAAAYFDVRPDVNLHVMRPNQTLAGLTARCLEGLDDVIARYTPDCVVGQGDTTTAFAAALAAFYRRVPFVHVEAGLRTGDLRAPWPEEFNRRAAALATSLHCAPTQRAADNLLAEGFDPHTVQVTGNTVIDALLWAVQRERLRSGHWRRQFPMLTRGRLVLVTAHRRESFGVKLQSICRAIDLLARAFESVDFVFPVHPNPQVREPVHRLLRGRPNVHLLQPLSYPEFVWIMDQSSLILTDSGGVQEEAPSLRKPVLVLRETTERPEAVAARAAELVGTDTDAIASAAARLLDHSHEQSRYPLQCNPYGDGHAAKKIADLMLSRFCTLGSVSDAA